MSDDSIKLQPIALDAWKRFAHELHVGLAALDEDEYLIVSIKGTNFYVQFAAQGAFGARAEAVSNFYLPERESLNELQHRTLLGLGWHPPTRLPPELQSRPDPDGSPNYFLDIAAPVPHEVVAALAVNTLRKVYEAAHPGELQYSCFAKDGTSIKIASFGIRRKPC